MKRHQRVLAALGLAAILAGAWLSVGPPRMTVLNATIRLDFPWLRGAAMIGMAAGAALAAVAAPRRWLAIPCGLAAAAALFSGAGRLYYRLEFSNTGVLSRGLLGSATIPWQEVSRVQAGADLVTVWGGGDAQIRVDTAGFRPDQRATIERTIARHVQESRSP